MIILYLKRAKPFEIRMIFLERNNRHITRMIPFHPFLTTNTSENHEDDIKLNLTQNHQLYFYPCINVTK